ncbi:MAG: flagellar export protein FliJ [Nitrospirae bacterium]|nr:flagellar export protein FliJ [Nitrospirota bacterium]
MSGAIKSLLSIKKWKEDEAKNMFAVFIKELDTEEKRLLSLEEQFQATRQRLECSINELININELKRLNEYLDHVLAKIERQKKEVVEKEKQVEEARNVLVDATKDRKIFEKLDEKQRDALEKENKRKEQIGTDEHAASGHRRKGDGR